MPADRALAVRGGQPTFWGYDHQPHACATKCGKISDMQQQASPAHEWWALLTLAATSMVVVFLVAAQWPPPHEIDPAAATWVTAPYLRVAWTPSALILACVLLSFISFGIGALVRVRLFRAAISVVMPYALLSLIEGLVYGDRHVLLPIEWLFSFPLTLLGISTMIGIAAGDSRRLRRSRSRDQRGHW